MDVLRNQVLEYPGSESTILSIWHDLKFGNFYFMVRFCI